MSIRSNRTVASWLDPRPSKDSIEKHTFDACDVSTNPKTSNVVHFVVLYLRSASAIGHRLSRTASFPVFSDRPIHVIGSCLSLPVCLSLSSLHLGGANLHPLLLLSDLSWTFQELRRLVGT